MASYAIWQPEFCSKQVILFDMEMVMKNGDDDGDDDDDDDDENWLKGDMTCSTYMVDSFCTLPIATWKETFYSV